MRTARPVPLPSFFILGAAKAGTTTLYDLLRQHPQVFLPVDKEPMFFSRDEYYRRGKDWYANAFFRRAGGFRARGEATPHYLYWAGKVAPRVGQAYGATPPRFIIILRDPVERARSAYWNMVRDGAEPLPFTEALQKEEERIRLHWDELYAAGSMRYGYVRGGLYASQIGEFLKLFPGELFHILLLDDLRTGPASVMKSLCVFLHIDPGLEFKPGRSNPAAQPRSQAVHRVLREPSRVKSLLKSVLPRGIRYRARNLLAQANLEESDPPELEPDALQFLRERFAPENAALAEIIGRDLSHWN